MSAIIEDYRDTLPYRYPSTSTDTYTFTSNSPSQEEFQKLKEEVQELKELLIKAKLFDEKTGQPDCEMDEKVDFIKKLGRFRWGWIWV